MNHEELLVEVLLKVFRKILVRKTEAQVKDTLIEYLSEGFVEKHVQVASIASDGSIVVCLSTEGVLKIKFTVTPQKVDGVTFNTNKQ